METDALGLYMCTMDVTGRVHVNGPMWEYFEEEISSDHQVQVNIFKDAVKVAEKPPVHCHIGFPVNSNVPALILLNNQIATAKSRETRETEMKRLHDVPADQSVDNTEQIHNHYRKVEIRSKKIQFTVNERNYLRMPNNDNRLIIEGRGVKYTVWAASEYEKRFPINYARFAFEKKPSGKNKQTKI
jgi:hypothetical protein